MSTDTTTTKPKWHPIPTPPPLSPRILNLPTGKTRWKKPKNAAVKPPKTNHYYKGKLESLFDQEREFSTSFPAIVLVNSGESGGGENGGVVAEKWRFQVEILRAECNFLRMEREFALKKLERNRLKMERTLHSAVKTLLSGKKKIYEGENVGVVLQEELEDLAEKLEEIQRSYEVGDHEVQKCSNFDKKAAILQRRLEKLGGLSDEKCTQYIPKMAESSLSSHGINKEMIALAEDNNLNFSEVEVLRMKMEGVSKGILDRMEEEYGSMISTTGTNSVASSSASTSMRIDFPDSSSFSTRQHHQEVVSEEERKCSGRCKDVVRRIVEQVRAETEQWSQMQDMLAQVRAEMEELQNSRDFWEDRALNSDNEIQSLQSSVEEWREKAIRSESKVNELETELSTIRKELEKCRIDPNRVSVIPEELEASPLSKKLEKEKHKLVCHIRGGAHKEITHKDLPPISLGRQLEKEKRIYFRRVKEKENDNHRRLVHEKGTKEQTCDGGFVAHRRTAFRDVGNVLRPNSNVILPMHCHELLKKDENL